LRAEYAEALAEKKKAYREYKQAKSDIKELVTARSNVERLLNITEKPIPEYNHDKTI